MLGDVVKPAPASSCNGRFQGCCRGIFYLRQKPDFHRSECKCGARPNYGCLGICSGRLSAQECPKAEKIACFRGLLIVVSSIDENVVIPVASLAACHSAVSVSAD
ncbi:Hypothetical predicted protein [Podarcis lilfordi]|uniref:Uncharacterized protein n=1 Tax=Podarcis lilfordi TaxID=74358 RepID=A0AA35NTN2_9SAUR|nr:Hypothetical predicted protein [Podarcis lilfordi]